MADARQRLLIEIAVKNQQALGKVNNSLKKIERSSLTMGGALKGALGAFAIIGGARLIGGLVNTIRTFEDLKATLITIEGDAKKAGEAFELIRKFTAGTTFQLEEVSNAFITFRNAGLNPTQEMMTNLGNIAAGMGKRLDEVAKAVFNATTGEFEMLKQLGIKVKTQGDQLTVMFRGTATKIKNDSASIVEYLQSIGEVDFAGAIDARANTLSGALSNLRDAIDEVAVAIGEGGLKDQLTLLAKEMKATLIENDELAQGLGELGFYVGLFTRQVVKGGTMLLSDLGHLFDFIANGSDTFRHLAQGVGSVNDTFVILGDTLSDYPLTEFNDQLEETVQITSTHQMKLDEYNMTLKESKAQQDRFTKAMENSNKEAADLAARFNHNVTALDLFVNGYNSLNDAAVSSITNVIMGTESLGDAIKNITQNALRSMISGFVQLFIVGPALKKIAEIMGIDMVNATTKQSQAEKELNSQLKKQIGLRLLLMLIGGGGFADGGTVGYANGGKIGFGGARAGGGPVGKNNSYLVGERGPELFVPNSAGTVVSNETMGGRMGETNINFTINAVDAQGFDELLLSRKGLIIGTIQQAFRQQGRRLA
tara:strand:- start:5005 stop:6792 length:1788 start_codon:yes stop_codon:yes gene_type:complete